MIDDILFSVGVGGRSRNGEDSSCSRDCFISWRWCCPSIWTLWKYCKSTIWSLGRDLWCCLRSRSCGRSFSTSFTHSKETSFHSSNASSSWSRSFLDKIGKCHIQKRQEASFNSIQLLQEKAWVSAYLILTLFSFSVLMKKAPLLKAVFPLEIEHNELTSKMTDQARSENLQILLIRILQTFVPQGILLLLQFLLFICLSFIFICFSLIPISISCYPH